MKAKENKRELHRKLQYEEVSGRETHGRGPLACI